MNLDEMRVLLDEAKKSKGFIEISDGFYLVSSDALIENKKVDHKKFYLPKDISIYPFLMLSDEEYEGIIDAKDLFTIFEERNFNLSFLEKQHSSIYDRIKKMYNDMLLKQAEALIAVMKEERYGCIEVAHQVFISSREKLIEEQQRDEEFENISRFTELDFSEHEFWINRNNTETFYEYFAIDDAQDIVRWMNKFGLDDMEINDRSIFNLIIKKSIEIEKLNAIKLENATLKSLLIEDVKSSESEIIQI